MAKLSESRKAELLAEREFLLQSLTDLDNERDDGGIDPDTYATLHSDYTARAAAVIRALDGGADQRPKPPPVRKGKRWMIVALIACFAIFGAFALSKAAGDRPPGGSLTGNSPGQLDPKSYRGHMAKAQSLREETKFDQATTEYLAAAKLQPDSAEPVTALAEMLVQRNLQVTQNGGTADERLLKQALTLLDTAIRIDPQYAQAYLYKGLVLDESKRPAKESLPMFQKYLDLAPNGAQAVMARRFVERLSNPTTTTSAVAPTSTTAK